MSTNPWCAIPVTIVQQVGQELGQHALAWRDHAEDLAVWTEDHLANRTDVWGAYLPMDRRGTEGGNNYTAPGADRRFEGALTQGLIKRHFCGEDVGHLIGLHAISSASTCRWLVLDIDKHGENDPATPEANFAAARGWWERLRQLAFSPILLDSNGRGGFHVLTIFAIPAPAAKVFAFGQWLVRDYAERGLQQAPETFPKQAGVTPERPYGNWWRLPGRHHTRDHWSRIWNGDRWVEGREAIKELLGATGDQPSLIQDNMASADLRVQGRATNLNSSGPNDAAKSTANFTAKPAQHWLEILSGCAPGKRHQSLVELAGYLLRRGIEPPVVAELCVIWNEARNRPPRPETHVRTTVRDIAQREAARRALSSEQKLTNRPQRVIRREVPR